MSSVNKEVIDRLTPWLLSNLHSEDLDAKDMADYVVSLISAPGSQEQLYTRCKSELEEFLGGQTEPFVNALFQQITQLSQGDQEPQQTPPGPDNSNRPLSGGQEEFRRNFRSDFSPFSSKPLNIPPLPEQPLPPQLQALQQQQQQQQQPQNPHQQQQQGFPPFSPQMPGFPGVPPNMFSPFSAVSPTAMPPQFGFQGFGKHGKFNNARGGHYNQHNNHRQNQNQNQRKLHSSFSSIQNEHSVANRRLVVEQIPAEHLNKESVEQYFGRFGKLTNIKINEDQHLVDIEFEGHDQAVEAHKCPDPIFGNRFVKVFWRKHSADEEEPELDVEAVRRMQAIKQQQFEEKESKRKQLTTGLRTVMNEQAGILQRRQQMLQSGQVDPSIQAEMQAKSEELSVKLKQLKQELSILQGGAGNNASGPTRGGFRGRGSNPYSRGARAPRGTYRGGFGSSFGGPNRFQGASLDRRPKGVLLEGVTADKDETLRSELAARNYTDFQRKSDNSVVIEFADRKSAEEFFGYEVPELGEVKKSFTHSDSTRATPDSNMDES